MSLVHGSRLQLWVPHILLVSLIIPSLAVFILISPGGLIPMIPYFAMTSVTHALFVSIGITVVILLAFGFIKNYVTIKTKRAGFYGAVQTLIIGVLAAGTSYGIVRGLDSKNPVQTSC
jgi:VIT1/CCC1 family predicted Fe2+/Mn2+ transporter